MGDGEYHQCAPATEHAEQQNEQAESTNQPIAATHSRYLGEMDAPAEPIHAWADKGTSLGGSESCQCPLVAVAAAGGAAAAALGGLP
jgi:hypothetical protein